MDETQRLAEQFEANRGHLQAVAYRMLGSLSEANDAVQESWLRLNRAEANHIDNLGGWLTTVVARICLDMLRSRKSHFAESLDGTEYTITHAGGMDPEQEMLLADSVGFALMAVLDTLTPAERLAFVLHDVFAMPFEEIAPVLERTEAATRKLASRARQRVHGTTAAKGADLSDQREAVEAFLAASREGSFERLLALLDPDVVLHADSTAVPDEHARAIRGAAAVARFFAGRAQAARPALVGRSVGVVVAPFGRLLLVLHITIKDGRIAELEAIADPARLRRLRLSVLEA
jgi:RNA polymerase sigma-70 factor (ECF subfamily)